ncbi:MAG TPA: hypothetical protein VJS11_11540 [Acidobacteriaceae bacterium]|nr:hypothetical protein [Acidobacteriaceae bacterium]
MAARKVAVPESVLQLEQEFERFRAGRSGRRKLPDSLWLGAVEQARQHGVNVVAHTLRLDYNALKKRMGRNGAERREPSPAGFVELIGATSAVADEYVIEFESSPQARMRVQWKSATAPDWAALLRAWREVTG